MATETEDFIVFENSLGEEVSNDPRWHAKKTLKRDGVDIDSLRARIAELEAQVTPAGPIANAQPTTTDDADLPEDDEDEKQADVDDDGNRTYKELNGSELKALLKERDLKLGDDKTVGGARAVLIEADKASTAANDNQE